MGENTIEAVAIIWEGKELKYKVSRFDGCLAIQWIYDGGGVVVSHRVGDDIKHTVFKYVPICVETYEYNNKV